LTYWEGVDIPGDDLQVVIMGRLPFRAPGDPLEEAKLDRIRERGQSPFYRRSLPEAVLRFQQGFGRLIRTRSDRGVVIVFDPRVQPERSRYGRVFLDALGEVPREVVPLDDVVARLNDFWGDSRAYSD
jgi:ATP-dependent DNA helicase DinG